MFRIAPLILLLLLALPACMADGTVGDPQFPAPNAVVPSPNELRTCPAGVGCY